MNAIIALCHFCNEHGPRTLFCTQAFKFVEDRPDFNLINQQNQHQSSIVTNPTNDSNVLCRACRAFEKTFLHYISYEKNSQICYISQSTPSDSEVFSLVRKACLRTLHCEIFEDPIYFDDDKNGSVIGYEFRVKDSEARGQQRQYSLLIIMKDRIHLQQLWSFLQHHIHNIAVNIKNAAQQVFDIEMSIKDSPTAIYSNSSNILKKGPNKTSRGLIDLTNDKLIFSKLHMWFTWILRACVCRLKEEFLCGPPLEDVQIKLEQLKLQADINENGNISLSRQQSIDIFDQIDGIETNQFKVQNYNDLISLFGYEKFRTVAYHVVVGNQVIIRSELKSLVTSIIELLEELIPYGCRKTREYSDDYINSYECNLLGVSKNFDPNSINSHMLDDYILLDIITTSVNNNSNNNYFYNSSLSDIIPHVKVNIKTNTNYPIEVIPEVLIKMENFFTNSSLDINSIKALLKWTREEWLNKAKVFYKYSKANPSMNINHSQSLLKFLKLEEKDELSLKFWQTGLSNECKLLIRAT